MLDDLLPTVMSRLAARRPIFHSEADFQLALAWEIQMGQPEAQIRLEKRVADRPRIELDLLVTVDGHRMALELKYPKGKVDVVVEGERFVLPAGAPDVERYDFWRDLARIERLVAEDLVDEGCALLLTNQPGFWRPPARSAPTGFDAFRAHEGTEVSGELQWGATAGSGTRAQRERALALTGRYALAWRDFSNLGARARLRYLAIVVPNRRMHA